MSAFDTARIPGTVEVDRRMDLQDLVRRDFVDRAAVFTDGDVISFGLFPSVPGHRVPQVVSDSGRCVDGWIPVNPLTVETAFPDGYAVGGQLWSAGRYVGCY